MTSVFTSGQVFVLGSQSQGVAISTLSNIAEDLAKRGARDRAQSMEIAQGSSSELDTHADLARQHEFLNVELHDEIVDRIEGLEMLLSGLLRSIVQQGHRAANHFPVDDLPFTILKQPPISLP